ncbi:MAG: response regulator [Verrucomicrobiota bacterium]|jgi:CheY-like chemotaxis protein
MPQATVLYVEDEEFDVMFMHKAFERMGLKGSLKVVADGQQAIDYMAGNGAYADRREHPLPAVVLLDLKLPVVSGFEVLEWLRQQPELKNLPVVVFSSSDQPEDQAMASQLGANDFVQKPSSALEFPKVVERLRQRWMTA